MPVCSTPLSTDNGKIHQPSVEWYETYRSAHHLYSLALAFSTSGSCTFFCTLQLYSWCSVLLQFYMSLPPHWRFLVSCHLIWRCYFASHWPSPPTCRERRARKTRTVLKTAPIRLGLLPPSRSPPSLRRAHSPTCTHVMPVSSYLFSWALWELDGNQIPRAWRVWGGKASY